MLIFVSRHEVGKHGVLARVRDFGLELVSVTLEAEQGIETAAEV